MRIVDDNVSVALSDFNYSVEANGESRFYLFRMTTTSEDTYLIHLTDNSWIVIDGGMTQFNDTDPEGVFVDDLYNFMAERSGLTEGEKLVISCCSDKLKTGAYIIKTSRNGRKVCAN